VNLSINRILSLTALAAFASSGIMQAAEQATFHLPFAAHWGPVVLKPGAYKMSLPVPSAGAGTFQIVGVNKSFFELPQSTDVEESVNSSYLTLVKIDGSYFVREFASKQSGKRFTFGVPKTNHRQEIANGGGVSSLVVAVN